MPSTYNGLGTAYLGKKDVVERRGVCPHCGRIAGLRSYTTSKCFVILYAVPLLPLGRKRVIDECLACRRHQVSPAAKWEAEGQAAVDGALAEIEADPNDPDAATRALATAVRFQRRAEFEELAEATAGDPAAWSVRQVASEGHAFFRDFAKAGASARAALPLAANDDERRQSTRSLAEALALGGDAEGAAREAEPLRSQPQPGDSGTLLIVAEALAARGSAREGIGYLEATREANPALAEEKFFKRLEKRFAKAAESGKELKPELLAAAPSSKGQGGSGSQRLVGVAVLAAIALLVAGMFVAVSFFQGGNRRVYFVNSTPGASVVVGGVSTGMPVGEELPMRLAEGPHAVTLTLRDGRQIDRGTVTVPERSFFGRIFDHSVVVINPDEVTALRKVPINYGTAAPGSPERIPPALLHVLPGIDDAFEISPDNVELPTGQSGTVRHELWVADETPEDAFFATLVEGGLEGGTALAYERIRLSPEDPAVGALATMLGLYVEPEDVEDALGPELEARPVRVNAHLAWQEAAGTSRTPEEVAEKYAAMLDEAGDEPGAGLLFLAAASATDRADADRWLDAALAADPAHTPSNARGVELSMLDGDLEEALDRLDAAGGHASPAVKTDLFWATGRWEPLRERLPEDPELVPTMDGAFQIAVLEGLLHGPAAAESAARVGVGSFAFDGPKEATEMTRRAIANAAYAGGDADPLTAVLEADAAGLPALEAPASPGASGSPASPWDTSGASVNVDPDSAGTRLNLALLQQDTGAVVATLNAVASGGDGYAVLANGQLLQAAAWLAAAEASGDAAVDQRRVGELVEAAGEGMDDATELRLIRWTLEPTGRALPVPVTRWRPVVVPLAIVRAAGDPANRAALLDLAENLNTDPREPHLLYAAAIDRLRNTGP